MCAVARAFPLRFRPDHRDPKGPIYDPIAIGPKTKRHAEVFPSLGSGSSKVAQILWRDKR
jgi:hypothetical protein